MFDALIDPLQLAIVLMVIAIVVVMARWGTRLAPPEQTAACTEERDDRPTTGVE